MFAFRTAVKPSVAAAEKTSGFVRSGKKHRSTCDTHDKLDEDDSFVAGFIEKRDAGRRLGAVAPKGPVFATGLVSRG